MQEAFEILNSSDAFWNSLLVIQCIGLLIVCISAISAAAMIYADCKRGERIIKEWENKATENKKGRESQ